MRTFIAIELPNSVKAELAKLQTELRRTGADIGWTNPENIHLTLRFLGEIEERKVDELKRVCAEIAAEFQPFSLCLKDTGYFPDFRRPRVLWVGLGGSIEIAAQLQNRLEQGVSALGFDREDKSFKPHLTIGRVKSGKNVKPLVAKADMYPLPELPFDVGEIVLFKSELLPAGARYTALGKWKLR
ncbi:MAG: RNA 2',3'-cyclic phosphodiesterase [Acidobacteria bacterium]|nr:RNA 2',3'-cyclic phosphodiesterase [Acidobacteriota bacterium]